LAVRQMQQDLLITDWALRPSAYPPVGDAVGRIRRCTPCPVDRQQQRRAVSLLLSAARTGDVDGCRRARRNGAVQQRMRAVSRLRPRDEAAEHRDLLLLPPPPGPREL